MDRERERVLLQAKRRQEVRGESDDVHQYQPISKEIKCKQEVKFISEMSHVQIIDKSF